MTHFLHQKFVKIILSQKDNDETSIYNMTVESKNTIMNELKNLGFNSKTSNHTTKLNVMKRFIDKCSQFG